MNYIVSKLFFDHLGNLRFEERSKEAIPIEWIKNWIIDRNDWPTMPYNNHIWHMLDDWEKENETDR